MIPESKSILTRVSLYSHKGAMTQSSHNSPYCDYPFPDSLFFITLISVVPYLQFSKNL